MELSLTFLVLLILQISSFNSLHYKGSSCGFESCNYDPSLDDSISEFLPSDDNRFPTDGSAQVRTTKAPPKSKDKALNMAESAADAAQAANEALAGAAQEASRQVKMQLADKATDAARTAQAVFEASQVAYDNLERQLCDEVGLLEQLRAAQEASEANANIADAVCTRVEQQKMAMEAQLEQTRVTLVKLDDLLEQASDDLEEKNRILAMLKESVDRLSNQMKEAKLDYNQAEDDAKKINSMNCRRDRKYRKAIPRSNRLW